VSRLVNFVFDGPPGEPSHFVEVEDANTGRPLAIGQWLQLPDGLWGLQVRILDLHWKDIKVESLALNAPDRFIQREKTARDPRRSLP